MSAVSAKGKGKGHATGKGAAGKGAKGVAQSRHKRRLPVKALMPTRPGLRRLARRAGILRIATDSYPAMTDLLVGFLANRLFTAVKLCDVQNRRTLSVDHILSSLRRFGTPLFGVSPAKKSKKALKLERLKA